MLYVHKDSVPKIATPNSKMAFFRCHLIRFSEYNISFLIPQSLFLKSLTAKQK